MYGDGLEGRQLRFYPDEHVLAGKSPPANQRQVWVTEAPAVIYPDPVSEYAYPSRVMVENTRIDGMYETSSRDVTMSSMLKLSLY
jgi:hypothetical protein